MTFYIKGHEVTFEGIDSFKGSGCYRTSELLELVEELQLPKSLDPIWMMSQEFSRIDSLEDMVGSITSEGTGSTVRIYKQISANAFVVPIIRTAGRTHIVMQRRMYPKTGDLSFIGLNSALDIKEGDPIGAFEEKKGLKLSNGDVRKVELSHGRSVHFVTLDFPELPPSFALRQIATVWQKYSLIPLDEFLAADPDEFKDERGLGTLSRFATKSIQDELGGVNGLQLETSNLTYLLAGAVSLLAISYFYYSQSN